MNTPEFHQLMESIYYEMVPQGLEHDPMMRYRADLAMAAAARGWNMAMDSNSQNMGAELYRARQEGYAKAMSAANSDWNRISSDSYQRGFSAAQKSMKAELDSAYSRGYMAGQAAAGPAPQPKSANRNDIIAEAMEQCRVIQESNPSMAEGAKACKRMIKKMMK